MFKPLTCLALAATFLQTACAADSAGWQTKPDSDRLDAQVRQLLNSHRGTWHDLNVPEYDGQILYNIVLEHKYRRALEIGTSTGHSGIWIAWALSKTGGHLITIEIDSSRREQALANFQAAGLSRYIDSRLGDAHTIVPSLKGPFDFVFSDADKDWYKKYLADALPKLSAGGCFVAHNISERSYAGYVREFLEYVRSLPYLETTLTGPGGAGMSVSYKRAEATPPR